MRNLILATMTMATVLASPLYAADTKAPKPDVGPGQICWFDITTTNLQKSKEFYGKLFDWQFTGVKGGGDYTAEIVSNNTPIGTLRIADGKISPYNGVVYVQVNDVAATCKKAKDLGGTIPEGFPFNLPDGRGAICLVTDPAGHPMGMYSRTLLPPRPTAKK